MSDWSKSGRNLRSWYERLFSPSFVLPTPVGRRHLAKGVLWVWHFFKSGKVCSFCTWSWNEFATVAEMRKGENLISVTRKKDGCRRWFFCFWPRGSCHARVTNPCFYPRRAFILTVTCVKIARRLLCQSNKLSGMVGFKGWVNDEHEYFSPKIFDKNKHQT